MAAATGLATREIEDLRDFMQRVCFAYGDFTLASGLRSKYFYEGKYATLRPSKQRIIGKLLAPVILASGAQAVGGLEFGAVPIIFAVGAAALELDRDVPTFVVRKEQKDHGTKEIVAQSFSEDGTLLIPGKRVAIVDDVITRGGSVRQALDEMKAAGCEVVLILVLVERHEGGADDLRAQGYDVLSLFKSDAEGTLHTNEEFLGRRQTAEANLAR